MEKDKMPLIEYFLVIGLSNKEINQAITPFSIDISKLQRLPLHILEEYKSNRLPKSSTSHAAYINNILTFCFPNGIDIKETQNNFTTNIVSFAIYAEERRKHVTCFYFYENYMINNKPFSIHKCFCLISSKESYATHHQILGNLYNIVTSSKLNKPKYIFLKDINKNCKYTVVQETKILEFYISFFLNTLWYNPLDKDIKGVCVKYAMNNSGYSMFTDYHIENKHQIPIKDYDICILVDRFKTRELIQIYISMLIEYKLILIFQDYSEINQIIFSLISLLYPCDWKLLPVISFITEEMIDMLEAPLAIIMGAHISFLPSILFKIKEGSITSNTLIYDLTKRQFILINEHFPKLPSSIFNELELDLNALIAERSNVSSQSKLNNDMNIHAYNNYSYRDNLSHAHTSSDIEFYNIFQLNGEHISLSPIVYFNYKLVSVFYKSFVNIIKNIDECVNWDKVIKQPIITPKTQLHEYFDYKKFKNDPRCINEPIFASFMNYFAQSMKLTEFVRKYIFKCFNKNEGKYYNVRYLISLYNTNSNKINVKNEIDKHMKNKMIEAICDYYNYTYVSLDDATSNYLKIFKDLSISKRDNVKEYIIWPPIEIYKIMSKTFSYEDYIIQSTTNLLSQDCDIDEYNSSLLPYQKTYMDLLELLNNTYQINSDACSISTNNNMSISKSFDRKSSPSFKQKEYLDDIIKQFDSKSPFKFNNKAECLSTPKENYHRYTSSQSYEVALPNSQPNTISLCMQSNYSQEKNSVSQFKFKYLASFPGDLNLPNIKIEQFKKSLSSVTPQFDITDTSTLGETIKESSDSLFNNNIINPFKANIALVIPIKKDVRKHFQDNLASIENIHKLDGDKDDFGIFSEG